MRHPRSTLYDLLGVARCATADEVAQAFRRQARLCHPEGPDVAYKDLVKLVEAWEQENSMFTSLL